MSSSITSRFSLSNLNRSSLGLCSLNISRNIAQIIRESNTMYRRFVGLGRVITSNRKRRIGMWLRILVSIASRSWRTITPRYLLPRISTKKMEIRPSWHNLTSCTQSLIILIRISNLSDLRQSSFTRRRYIPNIFKLHGATKIAPNLTIIKTYIFRTLNTGINRNRYRLNSTMLWVNRIWLNTISIVNWSWYWIIILNHYVSWWRWCDYCRRDGILTGLLGCCLI